jgi:DNA-binding NtrC family response regulator
MDTPRLLITDDDRSLRQALSEAMSRCGLEIATAGDGAEAIRLFDAGDVHLVIADFHMPRASGLDVIRHVRSRNRITPCFLISAELTEAIRSEAERMSAYAIFDKPLRLSLLRESVIRSLSETYGWKAG